MLLLKHKLHVTSIYVVQATLFMIIQHAHQSNSRSGPCDHGKYDGGCYRQANFYCDESVQQCKCLLEFPILIERRLCVKSKKFNDICEYNQQCDNAAGLYCTYSNFKKVNSSLLIESVGRLIERHPRCRCEKHDMFYYSFANTQRQQIQELSSQKYETLYSKVKVEAFKSSNYTTSLGICVQPIDISDSCALDVQCLLKDFNSICNKNTNRCECSHGFLHDKLKSKCEKEPNCQTGIANYDNRETQSSWYNCYKFNSKNRRCEITGIFCRMIRLSWIFLFTCVVMLLLILIAIKNQYYCLDDQSFRHNDHQSVDGDCDAPPTYEVAIRMKQ